MSDGSYILRRECNAHTSTKFCLNYLCLFKNIKTPVITLRNTKINYLTKVACLR